MVPDAAQVRTHASNALKRGFEEFVRSFDVDDADEQLNLQCSCIVRINQGIELLAKYWLYLKDPALVVSVKKVDDYLRVKGLIACEDFWERAHTITGMEALELISKLSPASKVGHLQALNSVRNSLEHFPVFEPQHLKQKIDSIAIAVLPELTALIVACMKEEVSDFLPDALVDAASACSTKPDEERRYFALVADHQKKWKELGEKIQEAYRPYPKKYDKGLDNHDLDRECPVCGQTLKARYTEVADYDDDPHSPSGVYGDVRCVFCPYCYFWTDEFFGMSQFVEEGMLTQDDLYPPDSDYYDEGR